MAANTTVLIDASRSVRRIAEVRLDEPTFITVYVNLDPSQFGTPPERDAQIDSLMHELRTQPVDGAVSHEGRNAVLADIERIEHWTRNEMDPDGIRGVGIFCASAADVFETIAVPAPVGPSTHVAHTAHLRPLVTAIPASAWWVLLVNRRTARIFRGNRHRLDEVTTISDEVHGQHDQGGWSQARYERSVEKEVTDHIRNACDQLFGAFKQRSFDRLLLGCSQELRPAVESALHPYLFDRLVDHFEGEVEHVGADDVSAKVRPLIEMDERRNEAHLIERLSEQLGRRDRAASGIRPVLDALNAKAVEVLLLAPGFESRGAVCVECDRISTDAESCPVDGNRMEPEDDISEWVFRSAIVQAAQIHEVRYHDPEPALGDTVAGLLRFDVDATS